MNTNTETIKNKENCPWEYSNCGSIQIKIKKKGEVGTEREIKRHKKKCNSKNENIEQRKIGLKDQVNLKIYHVEVMN